MLGVRGAHWQIYDLVNDFIVFRVDFGLCVVPEKVAVFGQAHEPLVNG
jgi:hypothetical protein